ncbi:MAG: recombination protein RecR [Paludibacteraceae bacterium]|nr:recombination protein RecR [Paludibacteraceae bacterium]MBR6285927.1 recombination protein RecR [Bacteroidaceae bacterium]
MSLSQYSSPLLEKAVQEFSKLPGIGKKTAMRLVLHLLRQEEQTTNALAESLVNLRRDIHYCQTCHNISDSDTCQICADTNRDASVICVVENVQDVMAIEQTHQFNGLYHVLGGVISPMDGVGPSNLEIDSLVERVKAGGISEIIFALSPTMEGDTTNFYIYRRLADYDVRTSIIARGVSVGDELEYADSLTLGRSIVGRVEFNGSQH